MPPASQTLSGNGNPNGVVNGNPGDFYQDQTGRVWVNTAAPSTWTTTNDTAFIDESPLYGQEALADSAIQRAALEAFWLLTDPVKFDMSIAKRDAWIEASEAIRLAVKLVNRAREAA